MKTIDDLKDDFCKIVDDLKSNVDSEYEHSSQPVTYSDVMTISAYYRSALIETHDSLISYLKENK